MPLHELTHHPYLEFFIPNSHRISTFVPVSVAPETSSKLWCFILESNMPKGAVLTASGTVHKNGRNTGQLHTVQFAVCWANIMPDPVFSFRKLLFGLYQGRFWGIDPFLCERQELKDLYKGFPFVEHVTTGKLGQN